MNANIDDRTPIDMSLTIQAMTQEKLSLALPVMFTIGPESVEEKLKKYSILLTGNAEQDSLHVRNVVRGVIEGEIRYLTLVLLTHS
jgi:flotillin